MKRSPLTLLALVFCLVGLSEAEVAGVLSPGFGGSLQRQASPFSVGEVFPDIALPSLADGGPTRISDFRGRKVMLHVFASW